MMSAHVTIWFRNQPLDEKHLVATILLHSSCPYEIVSINEINKDPLTVYVLQTYIHNYMKKKPHS